MSDTLSRAKAVMDAASTHSDERKVAFAAIASAYAQIAQAEILERILLHLQGGVNPFGSPPLASTSVPWPPNETVSPPTFQEQR